MKYYIYNWYNVDIASTFPEATVESVVMFSEEGKKGQKHFVPRIEEVIMLEIPDLHEFILQWGKAVQVVPPTHTFPYWSLYVSSDGKWNGR